jgi:hypothetical protein
LISVVKSRGDGKGISIDIEESNVSGLPKYSKDTKEEQACARQVIISSLHQLSETA